MRLLLPTEKRGLSVCLSIGLSHSWTNGDAVWVEDSGGPKEPCIRWGSYPPMGRTSFEGKEGAFHCKARLPLSVQKWLNRKRCCLGFGLRWAQGSTYYMGVQIPMWRGNFHGKGHARPILELCAVNVYHVEYWISTPVSTLYPCNQ